MSQPPSTQQVKQLKDSVKKLTRAVDSLVGTILQLNARLEDLDNPPASEQETETPLSDNPIRLKDNAVILCNDADGNTYVEIETVHGHKEILMIPKRNS